MFLAIFASGCGGPTTRFVWGDYESALYAYYKAPGELVAYREALREAIEEGEAEGKLAPGLCAELGYTYLEEGDLASATQLFELEMQNFPESRPFLGGLIQRLSPQSSDGAGPVS